MYHNLPSHHTVCGQLGGFQFGAVRNNTAVNDLVRAPFCCGCTWDWNSGVVGCVCVHAEISVYELSPEVDEHHERQVSKPSFHHTLLFLDLLEKVGELFRLPLDAVRKPTQFWPNRIVNCSNSYRIFLRKEFSWKLSENNFDHSLT